MVGCGSGSSDATVKQGGKEEGKMLGLTFERMGPLFAAVVRSASVLIARMMPIVDGRHTRLRASLEEPCALDLLLVMRIVDRQALNTAVDCSVLEIPPFDPMDMGKPLCPLGKQQNTTSFLARGAAVSARGFCLNLNLRTWSKMLVSFNLALGWVVGKLLGRFAEPDLGLNAQRLSSTSVLAENQTHRLKFLWAWVRRSSLGIFFGRRCC